MKTRTNYREATTKEEWRAKRKEVYEMCKNMSLEEFETWCKATTQFKVFFATDVIYGVRCTISGRAVRRDIYADKYSISPEQAARYRQMAKSDRKAARELLAKEEVGLKYAKLKTTNNKYDAYLEQFGERGNTGLAYYYAHNF